MKDVETARRPDPVVELIDDCRTPYPEFAAARRQGGVLEVTDPEAGAETAPRPCYAVYTYDAVSQVLRDPKRFSSKVYEEGVGSVMGPTILAMDEPEHGQYRGLIQMAFTRKALQYWERETISPIATSLIDSFADRGRADLVGEFTFPFPVQVIAGMLGLPSEDWSRFRRWAVDLIHVSRDQAKGMAASQRLAEYLTPKIEARRKEPGNDLISLLAQSELDGHRLDDEHILGFLRLLLPAGAETTYRSLANFLFGLLTHPDQLDALRRDRSLMTQAIEEGLRWEAPLTGISRLATEDTEVCGVTIPRGAIVNVVLASANRDETRFEDPERFDIFRPQRPHMAFATGPHYCLGLHLAKAETRLAVNAVLDRLVSLRLDPQAHDVHIAGRFFRSPKQLPVLFD